LSRKFAPMVIAPLLCGSSPRLFAQERVEAGIFLEVMMEGELVYDYGINFREAYRNITDGDITSAPCNSENLGVVSSPPLRFHPRGVQ